MYIEFYVHKINFRIRFDVFTLAPIVKLLVGIVSKMYVTIVMQN